MSTGLPDWYVLQGIDLDIARYGWKYGLRLAVQNIEIQPGERYYIVERDIFLCEISFKNYGTVRVGGQLQVWEV